MIKKERIFSYSIKEISNNIKNGQISPTELVEASLKRIEKFNPLLNAFITLIEEGAYRDALLAEKQIELGNYLGPLHGIPFSVKDIFYAEGIRCTAGSKILSQHVAQFDAAAVAKMKAAGAILIGTNTLNEFAGLESPV